MQINLLWKKEWTPLAIVGGSSFLIGTGIGYILGKRKEKTVVELQEIDVKDFPYEDHQGYPRVFEKKNIFPASIDDEVDDVPPEPPPEIEVVKIQRNVFHREDDDWDYDKEVANRDPSRPYIIHMDEFYEESEEDFHQSSIVYYEGDDVLCDEADDPILNVDEVVGINNLRFGHGSSDPNTVHIRNERRGIEYEILRHQGYYLVEVQGEEIEAEMTASDFKHSVPKFKRIE